MFYHLPFIHFDKKECAARAAHDLASKLQSNTSCLFNLKEHNTRIITKNEFRVVP